MGTLQDPPPPLQIIMTPSIDLIFFFFINDVRRVRNKRILTAWLSIARMENINNNTQTKKEENKKQEKYDAYDFCLQPIV